MFLDEMGNVGIGTTSPGARLVINESGTTTATLRLRNAINTFDFDYVGGSGVDRLDFNPGTAGAKVSFMNNGTVGIGTTNPSTRLDIDAGALELAEMTAPGAGAANTVRIYAVDNGSGKTQLMAIFSSGAAQQLAIQP
jgi:hypothetical protein